MKKSLFQALTLSLIAALTFLMLAGCLLIPKNSMNRVDLENSKVRF